MRGEAQVLSEAAPASGAYGPRALVLILAWIALTTLIAASISPAAPGIALREGAIPLAILLSATGWGLLVVRLLCLNLRSLRTNLWRRSPAAETTGETPVPQASAACEPSWELMSACGLGLGFLSLLMLGLGRVGYLQRDLWIALVAAGGVILLARLAMFRRTSNPPGSGPSPIDWLWLSTAAFAGLALAAATLPPGVLWAAEGYGYDALEYHLGAPRDYLDIGRITFLPHNIYSNFPFNVEMLYLLTMILRGSAVDAAISAHLLHLMLIALAVAALWRTARDGGPRQGLVAALVAASFPILIYVGVLAYVEGGLLLFTCLAVGCHLRARRWVGGESARYALASGLFAGFACGCKYTAVPAVLLPLALAQIVDWRRQRAPATTLPCFLLGAAITFSPWLAKNALDTGNPIFPLAHSWMLEKPGVWDDDGAARWAEGHLPAPVDRTPARRVVRLWKEVLAAPLFGPAVLLALLTPLLRLRRGVPPDASLGGGLVAWLMLLVGLCAWLGFTHLVGRFAMVTIIPVTLLISVAWPAVSGRPVGWIMLLGLLTLNAASAFGQLQQANVPLLCKTLDAQGIAWFRDGLWPWQAHVPRLNELTRDGGRVLMIADARRFYLDRGVEYFVVFNRNPFAEAASQRRPDDLLNWLRERGYTHVYVDWFEMRRLRGSRYGFWPAIDEALFERLRRGGLVRMEDFHVPDIERPYGTLFAVPARPPSTPPRADSNRSSHRRPSVEATIFCRT